MTRRDDFINRFAKRGYTKKDSAVILEDFLAALTETLVEGDGVMFRGFGSFEVRERAPRQTKDYQTGDWIILPKFKTVHFTPGKELKAAVADVDVSKKKSSVVLD